MDSMPGPSIQSPPVEPGWIPPAHPTSPLEGESSRRTRWRIWRLQAASGHEPCFATPQRFACTETGCQWRAQCIGLRAEWLR